MTSSLPVRNIILAGFMGTGKSTVGRALAARLGWTFADTDTLIEERAGKSISAIFAEEGEPAFRAMEAKLARELAGESARVIATGGGMIVPEPNLRALEAAGAVVLLEAAPDEILRRIAQETHRPLLAKPDPHAEVVRLLGVRAEAYGRVAIKVATGGKSPEQIADEILTRLCAAAPGAAAPGLAVPEAVRVELGARTYPILIGREWLATLGLRLAPHLSPRPVTVVTNPEIGRLWGGAVTASLERAGFKVSLCEIPEGEAHKTLATVEQIYDHLLERRATRQSAIVALGGGVVGDLAGFAAATLLRGVAFVQLPTTLLAMVDSSVGGKTGFNSRQGKNLIGAFWQPVFVGAELTFLDTLPDAELRAGLAEVIKYGVIADAVFFEYLEANIERALARDGSVLTHLVRRSCQLKAQVVGGDEREETGLRAILNFGHTFGHAAEALSGYGAIRHGEGVAMGMAAAARLAARRGLVEDSLVQRLEGLLTRAGLPVRLLHFLPEDYWRKMGSDKKVKDGRIRFVLPEALGRVGLYGDVTREEVEACLAEAME